MRAIAHVGLVVLLASGCAHFRVAPSGLRSSTLEQTRHVHALFWGALEPRIVPDNCNGNGVATVTVQVTMIDAIAAVLTVGFWTPVTVGWTCAKTPGAVRR